MFAPPLLAAAFAMPPAEDLAGLRAEVDALKKAVAEAATQQSLAQVEARLECVAAELEHTRQSRASDEDLRRAIDSLQLQVSELERRVAVQRVHAEDLRVGWPASAHASYDEGFALRGDDDRMLLRLNGYMQLRFEGADVDQHASSQSTGDRASFLVPRARLEMSGHAFTPQLTYRLLLDFTSSDTLLDAWVDWAPHPMVALHAGRFKTPFGRQPLVADSRFQLTDRADATDQFRYDRDLGAMATLSAWDHRVRLHAAVQNGNGRRLSNDNLDFLYTARVVLDPLGPLSDRDEGDFLRAPAPLVSVGASFLYDLSPTDAALVNLPVDVDGDGKIDNVGWWMAGADVAFRWRGFSLQAEWFKRVLDYGAATATTTERTWGAYGQLGYFVLPSRVELAARYSYAQPIAFGQTEREDLGRERHEATFGGTYLAFGRSAEAQLEYSYIDEESVRLLGGKDRASQRIRVQVQLGF